MDACIMCHEFKPGARVEDTTMLRALRKLKSDFAPVQMIWGKPTGHTLVVCEQCREIHTKRRKSYEGKVLLHAIIAGLLLLFIILLPILAGTFQIGSLLVGLLLAALLMSLPLLDYVPPIAAGEKWAAGAMGTPAPAGEKAETAAPAPDASASAVPPAPLAPASQAATNNEMLEADIRAQVKHKNGAKTARAKPKPASRGHPAKAAARRPARRR